MKSQKFYTLTINFTNIEHSIDRYLLNIILQDIFFIHNFENRDLAKWINQRMNIETINIIKIKEFDECEDRQNWWRESFAIQSINQNPITNK
jgi:hypothetical protein